MSEWPSRSAATCAPPLSLGVVTTVDTARLCGRLGRPIVGRALLPQAALNAARADPPTTAVPGAHAG
jgi:hypothetical protein